MARGMVGSTVWGDGEGEREGLGDALMPGKGDAVATEGGGDEGVTCGEGEGCAAGLGLGLGDGDGDGNGDGNGDGDGDGDGDRDGEIDGEGLLACGLGEGLPPCCTRCRLNSTVESCVRSSAPLCGPAALGTDAAVSGSAASRRAAAAIAARNAGIANLYGQ